jgi:hypothetical protein
MLICQYCGRLHETTQPDNRFCSIVCREEYKHYLTQEGIGIPESLAEAQRKQTRWVASLNVAIAKAAHHLLQVTEGLDAPQQAASLRAWVTQVASTEGKVIEINEDDGLPPAPEPAG